MRTTIELDPDIAVELTRRRREGRGTMRDDVNRLIRLGLARQREDADETRARFSTPTFESGPPLIAVDDVVGAIAHAEAEDHG